MFFFFFLRKKVETFYIKGGHLSRPENLISRYLKTNNLLGKGPDTNKMRHFLINVVMLSDAKFWYLSLPKMSHVVGLYKVMSHGKEKKLVIGLYQVDMCRYLT